MGNSWVVQNPVTRLPEPNIVPMLLALPQCDAQVFTSSTKTDLRLLGAGGPLFHMKDGTGKHKEDS